MFSKDTEVFPTSKLMKLILNSSYGNNHTSANIGTKAIRNIVSLLGKFIETLQSLLHFNIKRTCVLYIFTYFISHVLYLEGGNHLSVSKIDTSGIASYLLSKVPLPNLGFSLMGFITFHFYPFE